MSKKRVQIEEHLCRDCRHARPVLNAHPAADGSPIFCTCDYWPYWSMLNHQFHKCEYYVAANKDSK